MDDLHSEEPVAEVLRRWFREELSALLAQPEPERFECRACSQPFAPAERPALSSVCVFSGLELVRRDCPACGLIQGPLQVVTAPAATLGRLYELLYRFYSEGDTVFAQERSFYLLNPSRYGRYLNYGCGSWARGLTRLQDAGWDVWGYEPHLEQHHPRISRTRPEGPFDGLLTHNFLEHPQDPRAFFAECASLLKPGALMAHSTPCYEYLFEASPFHLFFFVGTSVQALADGAGFAVVGDVSQDRNDTGAYYRAMIFERL